MPGHMHSPYWATVDFESECEGDIGIRSMHRVYLDPWDTEGYGLQKDPESSQGENMNSFAGEPVSASFYYVPTKNYESEEESVAHIPTPPTHLIMPEQPHGSRRRSRLSMHDFHPEIGLYECEIPKRDRRRSYIEEVVYAQRPLVYESMYGYAPIPMMCQPRPCVSVHQQPECGLAACKPKRHSRMADAYEHFAYDSLSPDYEDWARPIPTTALDNFHLSRYGHLQIDYTYSWNSLDRLIRNS